MIACVKNGGQRDDLQRVHGGPPFRYNTAAMRTGLRALPCKRPASYEEQSTGTSDLFRDHEINWTRCFGGARERPTSGHGLGDAKWAF
jgi:hypothetical protein